MILDKKKSKMYIRFCDLKYAYVYFFSFTQYNVRGVPSFRILYTSILKKINKKTTSSSGFNHFHYNI